MTQAEWAEFLDPGEQVLWRGAPPRRISLHWARILVFIFGLIFLLVGIAIVVVRPEESGEDAHPPLIIGVFLIVACGWISFGQTVRAYLIRRGTRYAVTSQRALIVQNFWGTRVREIPITGSTQIEVLYGRLGTLWLGPRPSATEETQAAMSGAEPGGFVFVGIPNVTELHNLIRQVQRGDA